MRIPTTREDHRVAALAALAIAVHVLESAIPSPLPGVKPGLANVVTVTALVLYGWRVALWVGLLRVLAGSLVIGTFLSPTFMLSLAGAVLSLGAMGLGRLAAGGALSALGYSVLGAMGHMLGQVLAAYLLFIPHPALFQLLPVLLSFALLFGLVSGRIALALVRRMPADA
ncbi:MAG: Gx transporter family protein [Chromatiales bacterium]|jgi:heptaprenyl diphosphate synthase